MKDEDGNNFDIQADCYCVLTDRGDFCPALGPAAPGQRGGDRIVLAASRRWLPLAAAAAVLILAAVLLDFFRPQPEQFSLHPDVNQRRTGVCPGLHFAAGMAATGEAGAAGRPGTAGMYAPPWRPSLPAVLSGAGPGSAGYFVTAPEERRWIRALLSALDSRGVRGRRCTWCVCPTAGPAPSSSLRAYLNAMYQAGLDDSEPVAEAALAICMRSW